MGYYFTFICTQTACRYNMLAMKNIYLPLIIMISMVTGSVRMQAQSVQDIMNKLNLYQQKYPEETVYIQSDRNWYAPGDIIWFKAHILADLGEKHNLSRDLHVGLVDRGGQEVAHAKFLVDNDHVNGDFEIPLRVSPGKYLLMAYTSWMQNTPVERIFIKEIVIEDETPAFSVDLKLNDTLFAAKSTVRADIECLDHKKRPVVAAFQYKLLVDGIVALKGVNKTDKSGKAQVAFTLPEGKADSKMELTVDATVKNKTTGVGMVIPTPENILDVSFYPEGGMLIAGAERKIAFRAFNAADRPVDFEGEIFDNEKMVLKIGSTLNGIGSFVFTPEREQVYSLKITKPAGIEKTFELPEQFRSGVIMGIKSRSPEVLTLEFQQIYKRVQTYHFVGQMKGRIYWMESRRIDKNIVVVVPLGDFPAGVAEITAFDSALNLVARRLLFVNQNKKLHIEVIPDKLQYGKKDKTVFTIHVKDENGNPVQALLSMAAGPKYQQQPIANNADLFSLMTLKSDLIGFIPAPAAYFNHDETSLRLLDDLLIANAYNRFTWRTIFNTNEAGASYVSMDNPYESLISMAFNSEAARFCGNYLSGSLAAPGILHPLQPVNDVASWSAAGSLKSQNNMYNGRMTVREIVYQIKPYKLFDGKIYFDNIGVNSITNQDGAIIAINGILMGTDIAVLDGILPVDIDHINISTKPMDIQRYTGLNTMGVIEVFTKVNDQFKKPVVTTDPEKAENNEYRTPSQFFPGGMNADTKRGKSKSVLPGTIFWDPEIRTDSSGMVQVSFNNGKIPGEISVTVEGIAENGLFGNSTVTYTVK